MRLAHGFGALALLFAVAGAAAQTAPAPTATGTPPAPAPAPAATGEGSAPPAGSAAAAEQKPPSQAGGYTWTDKPARTRRWVKRTRQKLDPNAPLATYPGFRMLAGGKSSVWVIVSKKVPVDVRRAAGRIAFVLSGAQVASFNNTNPLVTHYFDTPLSRAWLRPEKGGAELVLELRENVTPTHKVIAGPAGTMILSIELPRAARSYAAPPVPTRDAKQGQVILPARSGRRK